MRLTRSPSRAAPIGCPRCGASFRAALTRGRCPICDWTADTPDGSSGIVRGLGDRWPIAIIALTAAGNIAVLIVVAVKVSGR